MLRIKLLSKRKRYRGIYTEDVPRDRKECANVLSVGVVGGNEQNKTGNGNQAESHHENAAFLRPVSSVSTSNRNNTSKDVWRDAHKLGLVIGVAHVLDDGGKEQGDRVKRGVDAWEMSLLFTPPRVEKKITDGNQHVDVDFPVLESGKKILGIIFVGKRGTVQFQPCLDFSALSFRQKLGTIILGKQSQTLVPQIDSTYVSGLSLTRNFAKAATRIVAIPSRMKIQAHPGLPPTPFIWEMARARSPPKAPANVAAEKKMAIRRPHSCRRYQRVMYHVTPGKRPPSASPKAIRTTRRLRKSLTRPMRVIPARSE